MVILHIASIGESLTSGVNVAVPLHIKAQMELAQVLLVPDLKEKAEERALKEGKRDRKEDKAGAETPEKNADKTSDIRKENFENKNE